jgi:hypothetical protein
MTIGRLQELNNPVFGAQDFLTENQENTCPENRARPAALILVAESLENQDHELDPYVKSLCRQIEKTHDVYRAIIGDPNRIASTIREAGSRLGREPSALVVLAHGNPHQIHFSKEKIYRDQDIRTEDFLGLAPDAKIYLISCRTGQFFAPEMARILKTEVYAPTNKISPLRTVFDESDGNLIMVSYGIHDNKQHVHAFPRDRPSETVAENVPVIRAKLSEQFSLLKLGARLGNPQDQFALAYYYLHGSGEVKQSVSDAKSWFRLAAEKGDHIAWFYLATLLEEESIEEAKVCYQNAADLGFREAKLRLEQLKGT